MIFLMWFPESFQIGATFLVLSFTAIFVERTKKLGSGDEFCVILDASSE